MSQKEKLLKAMKNNPKNISFADIKKLLEDNGYIAYNSSGSHFVFRKEGFEHIVIPHHKPIKAIYIKQVLSILGEES
jgi:predicted RNA binding protein YcfA (HicA-like mRNA interferase family)